MKMKKIAVWLLALAMAVTLAACGSSEKKESTAENKSGSSSTSEAKEEKKKGKRPRRIFRGRPCAWPVYSVAMGMRAGKP